MSVTPVGSTPNQAIGNLLLQQLMAGGAKAQDASSPSAALGDLMTFSPAAQQLAQAPDASSFADAKSLLLTELMNKQSNASNPAALLSLLKNQTPDSLFASLGDAGGSTGDETPSILG